MSDVEYNEELDPEIPSIFIKRALTNPDVTWEWRTDDLAKAINSSIELVAEHGDRFWEENNVKPGADVPYIYWSGDTDPNKGVRFSIPRNVVGKKVAVMTVRSVRRFPNGRGSWNLFRPAYQNICRCLTGVGYTAVKDGDTVLGHISQSRWVGDHKVGYTDPATKEKVMERGIVIEIIYN